MKNCIKCKFSTDYGLYHYCEIKDEIVRHPIRDALFCKFYWLTFAELQAIDEFLDNFPKMEEITGTELFNRYGR